MISLQTVFLLSFLTITPFWVLIIVLPNWSWTQRIIGSPLIVLPSALLYTIMLLPRVIEAYAMLNEMSLTALVTMFGREEFGLIVWLHMIAVDLLAGRWAYLDGQERGISAWVMAPVQFAILNFAPLGVLIYLGVRAISNRR